MNVKFTVVVGDGLFLSSKGGVSSCYVDSVSTARNWVSAVCITLRLSKSHE